VRKQQGLSRTVVARSAGLTRRELAAYERGRTEVPESDLWCLAGSCGVDVADLLPRRDPLHIAADHSAIGVGDTVRRLRNPEPDDMLREYLSMIYELRRVPPGAPSPLRQPDLAALADALGGTPESIEARLMQLTGVSHEEAVRLRTMILPPLSLPSPVRDASHPDPYELLNHADDSPAIEEFFSGPGPVDPFASAPVGTEPFATDASPSVDAFTGQPATVDPFTGQPATAAAIAPPAPAADPFAAPGSALPVAVDPPVAAPPPGWAPPPAPDLSAAAPPWPPPPTTRVDTPPVVDPLAAVPGVPAPDAPPAMPADAPLVPPSDPFAGPVDPNASAAGLRDPFAPPSAEDPLAPLPLPPDPFAAPPQESSTWTEPAVPEPTPTNGNGNGVVEEDPFAPPPMPEAEEPAPVAHDELAPGFSGPILDAIVVDDPMREPPAPATDDGEEPAAHDEVEVPDEPEADDEAEPADVTDERPIIKPSEPIAWHAAEPSSPAPTSPPAEPQFEKATADWQVGGVFPATAMADDGTLALRRADARWALTNLTASGDAVIETSFDLRTGSGFGIVFRASVTNNRITGYSFDMDPVAGGGGYLVRLWDGSRQHWRPLAHAPITDPARLYGHHVARITLVGDQLSVQIDADPVLEVPALSRATLEAGREPCRGDRVGIQAWATTEVTVESFRVAQL
jgi:transcriptional regulator with XRE-family HTH domain